MKRVWHLSLQDTRLFVLARESGFFMFIMPVMFMLFFSSVLGGGGPEKVTVSLPVIDEDGGWLAAALAEQLAGESFKVDLYTPAQAETTTFVRSVRIPAEFTARVLAGEQVVLGVLKSARSNVEFDAAAEVRLHQAQVAFLGNLIRWDAERRAALPPAGGEARRAGGAPARDDLGGVVSALGEALSEAGRTGAEETALPPPTEADRERLLAMIREPRAITVKSEFAGRGRPVPSGANQSIPGMLAMFVVMSVLIGGAESLTREKHSGTLARLATTPFSRGEILAGKLLHLTLVGLIQALVLMAAGQAIGELRLFGISFSWGPHWPLVVVLLLPYAFAVACLTLFVGGLFRTTQQAESLGWLVGMVIAALGGCWWPNEIMPSAVRAVSRAVPTSWAMDGLHGVITFGRGAEAIVLPSLVLICFGLILGWLGTRTMRVA